MEGDKLPRARRSRRPIFIAAAVLIVVALAIGLGVGLGIGLRNNDSDDSDDNATGNGTDIADSSTWTGRTFWQPTVNSTWQIILINPISIDEDATTTTPDVEVWDIDMFTNNQSAISKLQSLDKKVICYFSAGSYEGNRPDSGNFTSADKGKELDGWPGEYWLDTNSDNVRNIMAKRILYASNKGCDAIDPDNVDGFANDNGFDLTSADTVSFMQFLSDEANKYNMSTGLKNAGDVIEEVISFTHFSVNEQCVEYSECDTFSAFINASKPVFHIEYPSGAPSSVSATDLSTICSTSGNAAGSEDFSTVMKDMDLDGWVEYCDGSTETTETSSSSS